MSNELIALAQGIIDTAGKGHSAPAVAMQALEDEIERRGLQARYVAALSALVPHYQAYIDQATVYPPMGVWALIRATPEQRARAFLEAIK